MQMKKRQYLRVPLPGVVLSSNSCNNSVLSLVKVAVVRRHIHYVTI